MLCTDSEVRVPQFVNTHFRDMDHLKTFRTGCGVSNSSFIETDFNAKHGNMLKLS